MAIDTIWVFSQSTNGAPTTGTLELLTKARSLGAGTVAAFHVGPDAAAAAAALGSHGADEGLRLRRPRRPAPGAGHRQRHEGRHRRRRDAGAHPVPAELRGPRRHGPPLGQARPYGADQQHRRGGRRRSGHRHHADLRRQHPRHDVRSPASARTWPPSGRSRSRPRRQAAARPRSWRWPSRTSAPPVRRSSTPCTSRSRPARSWTRRRSSCPAGAASARRPTTR